MKIKSINKKLQSSQVNSIQKLGIEKNQTPFERMTKMILAKPLKNIKRPEEDIIQTCYSMVGRAGLEPATISLKGCCSTD